LSLRVRSCISATERIVMKSRVMAKRSGPSTGRLLMPALSVGSGRWPAATAMLRAAWADISSAPSWRERCCARRKASSRVRGRGLGRQLRSAQCQGEPCAQRKRRESKA
jgi:hypothetical protein